MTHSFFKIYASLLLQKKKKGPRRNELKEQVTDPKEGPLDLKEREARKSHLLSFPLLRHYHLMQTTVRHTEQIFSIISRNVEHKFTHEKTTLQTQAG